MGKRIVMVNKYSIPIGLYDSIEEASERSGYSLQEIGRCLNGTLSYIGKAQTRFVYETTAEELREEASLKRRKKILEKIKEEGWF